MELGVVKMGSLELTYEKPTMDISLAKKYYETKKIVHVNFETSTLPDIFDCYANQIAYSVRKITDKPILQGGIPGEILKSIADLINKNSELILQIEYSMRGVLPSCTQNEIKNIIEYFNYYADWTSLLKVEDSTKNVTVNTHVCRINLSSNSSLSSFAPIASAALSVGRPVTVYVESEFVPIMVLFEKLITEAGCNLFSVCWETSVKGTLFEHINKGTTFVIFENSDLNSALDSALNAAWTDIMSPWALKHIMVQESVYKLFFAKLTERMSKFEWNLSSKYSPGNYIATKVKPEMDDMLKSATEEGIDHIAMHLSFYSKDPPNYFKPLIILDNANWVDQFCQKKGYSRDLPVVTLQAFRTTKEASSLINNLPSTAVSIWCENSSIWNELAFLVPVSCVWINSYGCLNSAVNIEIRENNDKTFLGGISGLINNLEPMSINSVYTVIFSREKNNKYGDYVDKISKLHENWKVSTIESRVSVLIKAANAFQSQRAVYINEQEQENGINQEMAENYVDGAIKYLFKAACLCRKMKNECFSINKYTLCTEIIEPFGIIVVRGEMSNIKHVAYAIATAALFGNSVICSTHNPFVDNICKLLAENGLPVLSFVEKTPNVNFIQYDIIKGFWMISNQKMSFGNENFSKIYFWNDDYDSLEKLTECMETLKMRFCNRKIIWSTYGETFAT